MVNDNIRQAADLIWFYLYIKILGFSIDRDKETFVKIRSWEKEQHFVC